MLKEINQISIANKSALINIKINFGRKKPGY
jgi:hypothetical protein